MLIANALFVRFYFLQAEAQLELAIAFGPLEHLQRAAELLARRQHREELNLADQLNLCLFFRIGLLVNPFFVFSFLFVFNRPRHSSSQESRLDRSNTFSEPRSYVLGGSTERN